MATSAASKNKHFCAVLFGLCIVVFFFKASLVKAFWLDITKLCISPRDALDVILQLCSPRLWGTSTETWLGGPRRDPQYSTQHQETGPGGKAQGRMRPKASSTGTAARCEPPRVLRSIIITAREEGSPAIAAGRAGRIGPWAPSSLPNNHTCAKLLPYITKRENILGEPNNQTIFKIMEH